MRLLRYISGANEPDQKISMTTPVFIDLTETNRQMSFVLPKETASTGAPNPGNNAVRVETREGGRFAVYRFNGSWDEQRIQSAREKLASWLVRGKLQPADEPQVAGYDPPFTPLFMRRNEILVAWQGRSKVYGPSCETRIAGSPRCDAP
jgi:hypothetical protein